MIRSRPSSAAIALVSLLLLPADVEAQGLMDRKHPDIFPLDGKMKRSGFFVGPGVTYTLTRDHERHDNERDAVVDANYKPEGRFGLYLEAGWFLATRDPVILDYWDFGLAYKQLSGMEESSGTYSGLYDPTGSSWESNECTFSDRHLTFAVNANKLFTIRNYQFIQFSLGANVDWRFSETREVADPSLPSANSSPPEFIGQFHAKLGYGFKLTQQLMIIPAIETPFFSVQPEDENFGELPWFNSYYRPIIFSVRFLFLRYPNGWACPPVKNNEMERHKVVNPEYKRQ